MTRRPASRRASTGRQSREGRAPATSTQPDAVVHGHGELIAYLPYAIGFRPNESVVLAGTLRNQLQATVRADLPGVTEADDLAAALATGVAHAVDSIIIVFWTQDQDEAMLSAVSDAVERAFMVKDVVVAHVLVTDGTTFYALCGGGCPQDPLPLPEPASVDACMELILTGRAPVGSRDEATAALDPSDGPESEAVSHALASEGDVALDELLGAARSVLLDGSTDPLEHAVLIRALDRIALRDLVLGWLAPVLRPPGEPEAMDVRSMARTCGRSWLEPARPISADELTARLTRVIRWCPPERSVPLLTLLGAHLWSREAGALATEAACRAVSLDPTYQLAWLLTQLIERGVRPTAREIRPEP